MTVEGRPADKPRALEAAHRRLDAGLASNAAGRPSGAARQFRAALRALESAVERPPVARHGAAPVGADPESAYVRARALLGLAMSEYEVRADVDAALVGLAAAETCAEAAEAPGVSVAVLGQRGLLLMRAGRNAEALAALDRGVHRVDSAEPVDACCLLLNRGTLNLDLGRLDAARADLRECAERAAAIGDPLLTFKARHNLGYLEYLAGDLPLALATMADAATIEHDASPAVALLDRAHVLLEAGLVSDAEASLARAADLFAEQRLAHDLAETEVALARCALLQHRPQDALALARSARRRFARRGNAEWATRAELLEVQARLAVALVDPTPSRPALKAVARAAAALGARIDDRTAPSGSSRDRARSAWATAAEASAEAGLVDAARAALARTGRSTGREPLGLAVHLRRARSRVAFAGGDRTSGLRHVRAGQALLAEHRRHLGSMEALTSAAVHGERLAEIDVGAALRTGLPAAVLDAVERARATWAGPARVRPPDDPVLADLLVRLRRRLEAERLLPPSSAPADVARRAEARREALRLRDLVRERSWRERGNAEAPEPGRARDLLGALRRRPPGAAPVTVVDLFTHGGWVHAITVRAQGLSLHRLAPVADVTSAVRRVGADLGVLAGPRLPPALRAVVATSLDRGLVRLDADLLGPLPVVGALHVIAPGALAGLPWGQLPSRTGVATSVGTRLVLPSEPAADDGARPGLAVALAGPHLHHAEAEVAAVAAAWPSARAATGREATCAAALAALGEASVVHLAAHGRHESENPAFSWLRLADGPLFAHEMDGIHLPGSLVVLSACEVGQASVLAGGEALGFAGALVRLGASAVVAAVAPIRDDVAADVMPALHALLVAGMDPAEALARACSRSPDLVPLVCLRATVPLGADRGVGAPGLGPARAQP